MSSKKRSNLSAHCNYCLGEREHKFLSEAMYSSTDTVEDSYEISWEDTYQLLECCGCKHITVRYIETFSEVEGKKISYFPPAISRRLPDWISELTDDFQELLSEVYAALNAGSRRIAMMGARALIDMVILDTVGDIGTFKEKLDKLQSDGHVSSKSRDILEAALDMGSAASHRGHKPTIKEVGMVMDIVEHLLQEVYILKTKAEELRKSPPPRPSKKKT